MPTPKKPPTSVRLTDANESDIVSIMKATGWKKNAAISHLIALGAQAFRDMPKYIVRSGPAPTAPAVHLDDLNVPTGPVAEKPGSRLKQTARGKSKWAL